MKANKYVCAHLDEFMGSPREIEILLQEMFIGLNKSLKRPYIITEVAVKQKDNCPISETCSTECNYLYLNAEYDTTPEEVFNEGFLSK